MTEHYLVGLLFGLTLGIPVGFLFRAILAPVDRWLDDHRRP